MLQLVRLFQFVLDLLFGCPHRRTTFPLTPRRSAGMPHSGPSRFGTYVACLDCGKELAYDWHEMRVGAPVMPRTRAVETQPSFR